MMTDTPTRPQDQPATPGTTPADIPGGIPADAPVETPTDTPPGTPADERAPACDPQQQAGQDESIMERLERDPVSPQAKLDRALDESMDASDPPSLTAPGDSTTPAPSSGYDEEAEAALRRK